MTFLKFLGLLLCCALPAWAQAPKLVAYYPEWSSVSLETLPLQRIDVLNLAFAGITDQGEVAYPGSARRWDEIHRVKARYPSLRVLLSVGGWSDSARFSDVALSEASRRRFAQSLVSFLQRHQLDGADIDWEYPGGGGLAGNRSRPQDKENFTLLLQELRRQWPQGILSVAVCADRLEQIEPRRVSQSVDWLGIMTYDMQKPVTSHHCALYPETDRSVRAYLRAGVPPQKILLGIPAYGHLWTGVTGAELGRQATAGDTESYREILGEGDWQPHWDERAQAAWLYSAKRKAWLSYEDRRSLRAKLAYAAKRELGGFLLWEISGDSPQFSRSLLQVLRP